MFFGLWAGLLATGRCEQLFSSFLTDDWKDGCITSFESAGVSCVAAGVAGGGVKSVVIGSSVGAAGGDEGPSDGAGKASGGLPITFFNTKVGGPFAVVFAKRN